MKNAAESEVFDAILFFLLKKPFCPPLSSLMSLIYRSSYINVFRWQTTSLLPSPQYVVLFCEIIIYNTIFSCNISRISVTLIINWDYKLITLIRIVNQFLCDDGSFWSIQFNYLYSIIFCSVTFSSIILFNLNSSLCYPSSTTQ
jgi:hypothetical protein